MMCVRVGVSGVVWVCICDVIFKCVWCLILWCLSVCVGFVVCIRVCVLC